MESVEGFKSKWFFATVLTIFFFAFVTTQVLEAGAATTRNFTLYGSFQGGWGFTANNITIPGPPIVVEQGDTVNLTLISNDGVPHHFFVSYTNDSTTIGAGDPQSPDFTGTVNYSFNATNTVGTYKYFCHFHPTSMWGYLRVIPTGTIPEFQPLAMLSLLIVGVGIATLARRKRRRQI